MANVYLIMQVKPNGSENEVTQFGLDGVIDEAAVRNVAIGSARQTALEKDWLVRVYGPTDDPDEDPTPDDLIWTSDTDL